MSLEVVVRVILTGVFIREGYNGPAGGWLQFWIQAKSVLVAVVWSALVASVAILVAKVFCEGLRVDAAVEYGGLDLSDHGEEDYG